MRRINMLFLGVLNEAELLADKLQKKKISTAEAEATTKRLKKELFTLDADLANEANGDV